MTEELNPQAQQQRAEHFRHAEQVIRARFPLDLADAQATDPRVIAWCDAYIEAAATHSLPPRTWSLVLVGPTGTGKTYQAYGAIRRIVMAPAGVRVTWLTANLPDLLAELRPHSGTDAEAEYQKYARAGLLLVDDLGTAKDSAWVETTLYRLVNHRCLNLLPTIWTTNLPKQPSEDDRNPPPTLQSELSDRIFSRLAASRFVPIKGLDRRRAGPGGAPAE